MCFKCPMFNIKHGMCNVRTWKTFWSGQIFWKVWKCLKCLKYLKYLKCSNMDVKCAHVIPSHKPI